MSLNGIFTAMVTPFDQGGNINFKVTKELTNRLIDSGVNGLFILGTNGEFVTLNKQEKFEFAKTVIEETNGRVPVIVGVGGINSQEVIETINEIEKLKPDYLSVITPYFIKLSQDELYQHYIEISDYTELPILLYNIPSKTGNELLPETVYRLSNINNIVGIKDSSGNINNIESYINLHAKDFIVLAGTDSLILPTLKKGGNGAIAATSNVFPELVISIYQSYLNKNIEKASRLQNKLEILREESKSASVPTVFKKSLEILGINVGPPRKPVLQLNNHQVQNVKNMLEKYNYLELNERKMSDE